MHPYIDIFGLEITSYGLMALLGILAAFLFVSLRGAGRNLHFDDQLFWMAFILVFAVIGAKILYLLLNIPEIISCRDIIFHSPETLILYLSGGFVFYGGFLGGALGALCYAGFYRVNAVPLAENFIAGIPLFHFFGRIGCFLAGCCYGIEYDGVFSVTYSISEAGPNGVSLFPVQLLEAGMNLLIFFILLGTEGRLRKPLQNLGLYLTMYGTVRFFLEFLRGDEARGFLGMLSVSQWISLVAIAAGIYLLLVSPARNRLRRWLNREECESLKNF